MDIRNAILDIQISCLVYPLIELWITKTQVEYWISIIRFLDIHNSIYGYLKIVLNIGYLKIDVWISIIICSDLEIK